MPVGRVGARTVLVVTSLVLVALASACSSGDTATSTPPTSSSAGAEGSPTSPATLISPPVVPHPARAGSNRRLAVVAAARAIRHFPVPPGSTRIGAPPPRAPYLRRIHAFIQQVDTSLTRTRWWLVPRRYDRLVAWYVAHTPAVRGTTLTHGKSRPSPEADMGWQTQTVSKAYSSPAEVVAYTRLGPHLTAIRTDVTLAARADRTAETLVPATVTSLEISTRPLNASDAPSRTVTVTEQSLLFAVLAAFNGVPGEYVSVEPFGCASPTGIPHYYAVTLHWPGHTLAVDEGQPLCQIGRSLTLDGARLPQTLTHSHRLDKSLRAAFGGS